MRKNIELTWHMIGAILITISAYLLVQDYTSGAELGLNLGYVESHVDEDEEKVSEHDEEIASLKSRITELEAKLEKQAKPEPTVKAKPKIVYESKPSTRYVQRLASNRWTYPGRIEDHIREHGINPSGWSRSELEQIHANLHEGRGSGIVNGSRSSAPTRRVIYSQPTYRPPVYFSSGSYSNCPGGVCPSY